MASTKRTLPTEDESEIASKRAKFHAAESDCSKPKSNQLRVALNPADCDLDFDVGHDGLKGSALHEEGFAYCWSGARANVGINGGKYYFGCKIISDQPVNMEDTPSDQQHLCRIGISRGDDAVGNLGETLHGFGFGGTGKFSTAGKFSDYGEKYGVGDSIICAIDLESKPLASIGFSKNGKWLSIARQFNAGLSGLGVVDSPLKELQWESALFPHVQLKNVVVQLQFSVEEGLIPLEGYKPWASALDDGNAIMGPVFSEMRDCEVRMMVGLPASGKTTWAENWMKIHPEKRYVLLGTNLVLDQMKVPGLLRKRNYGERFDRLMSRANMIFDTLLSRAAGTPRNYLIDQTNVFKSARKRKLRPFAEFHKIAVVVFPKPEELKIRADKRFKEMGKEVPADALNNMLANYVFPLSKDMPGSDERFDEVIFVELSRGESQKYLDEMKHAMKSDSRPCTLERSIDSYTGPSLENRGALSVGGGHWGSPPPLNRPSRPLNYGYQITSQVNAGYQGLGSSPGAYQNHQDPSMRRVSVRYGTYESSAPRDSSGYSESYFSIPGGRTDPYHSYGVGDPYGRPNFGSKNTVFGADANSGPYRSNMVEPSPVGTARTTSLTYNTIGDPQASTWDPRVSTYLPNPSASTYGLPYGTPSWAESPSESRRPPYGHFHHGMHHSGGYNPPRPRYY